MRPANSRDVAGSVGRSTPTDPDRFLVVRNDVSFSQQRRTHALSPPWLPDGYSFLRYVVPCSRHCTICIMPCLLASIASIHFFIIGNARTFILSVAEVRWLRSSTFLSSRGGVIGNRTLVSLFYAEVLLIRNTDCLFHGIKL